MAIHSLFRVNGHYSQTAMHAETGITQNANPVDNIPSDTLVLPSNGHYCQRATHAETGIRKTKNLPITYLATHSLFRVNGHYCQTATHAETGVKQNANPIDNLPSDTLALTGQR